MTPFFASKGFRTFAGASLLSLVTLAAACSSSSNADPSSCPPPVGVYCCDGDVVGKWTCDSNGKTKCDEGTTLTPAARCITPPRHDAGPPDAASCPPPDGMECCDGDQTAGWTCDSNGATECLDGTYLTPYAQCVGAAPTPEDGGHD